MEEYNAAIQRLEGEINKAFGKFSGWVSVSCSEFLKELDVAPVNSLIFKTYHGEEWRFRHNPTLMLKAAVFMKLKGIKTQRGLMRHLQGNRSDAENLGCKASSTGKPILPARRTFNYFMGERLTREIWGLVDFIVQCSKETATKKGILLNFAHIERPAKRQSDSTIMRKKRERTREVCKIMRDAIYPKICMETAHNAVFGQKDFLDMLTHVALTHDFTENGSCTYSLQKGGRTPSADALLYHLKKYRHRKAMEEAFDGVFSTVLEMARKSGYLQRPIDIAIDTTDILYYGDRCDYMVVGTKPQKGTTWAFKFATVNAVLDGERFVLYAIPVGPKTRPVDIVAKLMTGIGGRVKIRRAYLDRGFFGRRVIEHLNRNGVKYIMPVRRDSRIESIMERHRPPYVTQYRMKKRNSEYSGVWFNLAVVKGMKAGCEDKVYAFATNIDFTANMAPAILSSYDRRWGIETAFRVKESFRARTTSKNYLIRLFYFMFSITLYNLWVLLNSLLSIMLFGKPAGKPIVTAKIFGTILCVADIT